MHTETLPVVPDAILSRIDRLDPLPAAAQQLLERLSGRDVSSHAIVEVIDFDQALAAAVLREARSMRYSAYRAPDTVREAVQRLGTTALLDVVLSAHLASMRQPLPAYDLTVEDQWAHSAAAQLAVRALAREVPALRLPAVAETAALMHDIGKLVMVQHFGVPASEITAMAAERGLTFVEAEVVRFGVNHADVGAVMAAKWNLPPLVVEAIQFHHTQPMPRQDVVFDAVALGNLVAKTVESGLGAEGLNLRVDPRMFARLGLNFAAFGRICLMVMQELADLRDARGMHGKSE